MFAIETTPVITITLFIVIGVFGPGIVYKGLAKLAAARKAKAEATQA